MPEIVCKHCGEEGEWVHCCNGCDDGYFDGYEEDPLWYDEDDLIPCSECRGRGGRWICPNENCPGKLTAAADEEVPA